MLQILMKYHLVRAQPREKTNNVCLLTRACTGRLKPPVMPGVRDKENMDSIDKNQEISIQTQQKFEFYLLALVFTILGLSIQTAKLTSCYQGIIELAAWASFLLSGLAGLSRMEWIPVSYQHYSKLTKEKSFSRDAQAGRSVLHESGQPMSAQEVAEFIKLAEDKIEERTKIMERIDSRDKIKYTLHKWLFVAGLVLLIMSRAINFYLA
jgi:hypothetical protein